MMEDEYVYKQVKSIVFGLLNPKQIKKMAAVKVVTPELYDKEGYPVDGGLMDLKMGVIDPGLRCKTCGSKLKECPGHFGYIELARPVMHINFVSLIFNLLKTSCRDCGRILLPQAKAEKLKERLDLAGKEIGPEARRKLIKSMMTSLKTTNKCPHCKARQQKITLEKPTTFMENDKRLTPIEVRARLEKLSDDDCELFGINSSTMRPEWAILTILPIPPLTMRPSITLESGERSEDDLTHKLGDIVRINQRLFENINAGAPEIIIEDLWDLLKYHVTTYFNNEVAQLPPARHRSGQPLKTLSERIKSKEGRIRYNLAGKRTNFSARTVISPDPMLKLNELGVPFVMATKLTVPERITSWNMEYFKKFVTNGPKKYPGANYIVRPDGRKKKITDETKEQLLEELQPGFIVERHLMDGDISIYNRQPSLHRMSMMCHRVRVLPGRTFRMNPSVCNPYNADFDGDEMNMHIPQTEEARAEAEIIMDVQTQLISPGYGLSVMGCIHDSISGNFLLTRGLELKRKDAIMLLVASSIEDLSKLPNKEVLSGKEIFSVLLPDDFNFTGHSNMCKKKVDDCQDPNHVIVEKGKLKQGIIDGANLGKGSGHMLRALHQKYGEVFTANFITQVSKLGINVLLKHGFSAAISDNDLPDAAKQKIKQEIDEAYILVSELIKSYEEGTLETFPGKTKRETLELKILETLNKSRNKSITIVSEYTANRETDTTIMNKSGARGSLLQLAQIAATIGQQALRGKRIEIGFQNRTLPYFKKNDLQPFARGFIRNGYKAGMSPPEFFFQAMTGRDSLMDTALRTPKSGYLYRRLSNAMQDLRVDYDNSVRDASNKIIQFTYGEDGIDVSKSVGGKIDIKRIIKSALEEN